MIDDKIFNIADPRVLGDEITAFLQSLSIQYGRYVLTNSKEKEQAESLMHTAITKMEDDRGSIRFLLLWIPTLKNIIIAYYKDPSDIPTWVNEWEQKSVKLECEEEFKYIDEYDLYKKIEAFRNSFYPNHDRPMTATIKEIAECECILKLVQSFIDKYGDVTPLLLIGSSDVKDILMRSYKNKTDIPQFVSEFKFPRTLKPLEQ